MENKEIVEALRMCCSSSMTDCALCPENGAKGGICFERLNKRAADTIEQLEAELAKLREEIQRMRNATSRIVERDIAELRRLAGEANTAVERGLYGVSDEMVSRMQEHMTELAELGRESMIHVQPLGMTGARVDLVKVGGEAIYRREGFGDEEPEV